MNPAKVLCMLLLMSSASFAQVNIDSLRGVWNDETQPDTIRLKALDKLIWGHYLYSHPDSAFDLAQSGYDLASKRDLVKYMGAALNIQGISFRVRGDYPQALAYNQRALALWEAHRDKKRSAIPLNNIGLIYSNQGLSLKALPYYERSLKIYEAYGDSLGAANVLINIGIIYIDLEDRSNALEYFQRGLNIYVNSGDKKAIADCKTNIGNIYTDLGDYQKSLDYHHQSLEIYEVIGERKGIANCMINTGHVYRELKDYSRALEYYQKSLNLYKEVGDKSGMANSLNSIGRIYHQQGNYHQAVQYCRQGVHLANEITSLAIEKSACKCLYNAYKALGNSREALIHYERMEALDDSLQATATARQLEQMEFQKQILADSLRQEEEKLLIKLENEKTLARESRRRNIAVAGSVFFILVAASLYYRVQYMRRSKAVIEKERDRSENLLLNILPAEVAEELKEKGHADARDYEMVSILFTDFKEFTQTAEKLSAQALVREINLCFEAFDAICGRYGIEKIKTIGDAYMAAGGLPVPTRDSVKHTVEAALEMQVAVSKRKTEMDRKGLPAFEMRVGIHTGPVVAGIVGVKKFQYDIWGDTVNTANRMENAGAVGKVNISQATYDLLKDDPDYVFESRGKIEVKGKGPIEMYFVERK